MSGAMQAPADPFAATAAARSGHGAPNAAVPTADAQAAADSAALAGMPNVVAALRAGLDNDASDVHLHAQYPPWMQVGGLIGPIPGMDPLTLDECAAATRWAGGAGVSRTVTWPAGQMWRTQAVNAVTGPSVTLRRLPSRPPDFDFLGPNLSSISDAVNFGSGLVIITGATGTGKSTTCAALLSLMNRARPCHVFCIENPIEVVYRSERALFTQVEVGTHMPSATDAFMAALRSAPDVIFLSEARSVEEMRLCLEASISGHLVITTMHAGDVGTVCERLVLADGKAAASKLAQAFQLSVAQRLVPDRNDPRVRHAFAEIVPRDTALVQYVRTQQLSKINAHVSNALGGGLDAQLARGVVDGLISLGAAEASCIDQEELNRRIGSARSAAR